MWKAYYFHGNPIRFYFKKHNCPICDRKLKIIMNHKIFNSKSTEANKYSDLFDCGDGSLFGDFYCDISHKVFYCTQCKLEIEKKTLFTYEDMIKKINNILNLSKSNHIIELKYLLDDGNLVLKVDNPLKIKKVIIYITKIEDNSIFIFTIFDSKYKENYAEEKFFFQTKEYKKVIKTVKKISDEEYRNKI